MTGQSRHNPDGLLSAQSKVPDPPTWMKVRCCKACGVPVHAGLCSYDCDNEEAGTFVAYYVLVLAPDQQRHDEVG